MPETEQTKTFALYHLILTGVITLATGGAVGTAVSSPGEMPKKLDNLATKNEDLARTLAVMGTKFEEAEKREARRDQTQALRDQAQASAMSALQAAVVTAGHDKITRQEATRGDDTLREALRIHETLEAHPRGQAAIEDLRRRLTKLEDEKKPR